MNPFARSSFTFVSDEVSQDPAAVLRFVREFGLSGFELRSAFGRAFKDLAARDVAEIRALAAGEGLRIYGCDTPVFKCGLDDAPAIRNDVDFFRRSLDVARELQCGLVRVFTFLRRPEPLSGDAIGRIAVHLTDLAELAAEAGIRIGIENECTCRIASGREMLRFEGTFAHPAAEWIWDPCNVIHTPGENGPATEGFAELSLPIVHIHVKDAVRTPGAASVARSVPIGEGEVGWGRHLAEIRESGCQGMLSLETHWRKTALDEKLLHLPAGYAFSAGGEEASRICMQKLLGLAASAESRL